MEKHGRGADISQHILPTAATMVGVCITVVGIVRLMEVSGLHLSIIDNIVAGDAVLFLASALLSFGALRTTRDTSRLERYADLLFLSALTVLVASSLMTFVRVFLSWPLHFETTVAPFRTARDRFLTWVTRR